MGDDLIEIEIAVDSAGLWRLNGRDCPEVAGCIDLDLNFSPSTNLLPIRRLDLAIGQGAPVRAAWLRFPSFPLEPLDQLYRRVDDSHYRYESAGGEFTADLEVDASRSRRTAEDSQSPVRAPAPARRANSDHVQILWKCRSTANQYMGTTGISRRSIPC